MNSENENNIIENIEEDDLLNCSNSSIKNEKKLKMNINKYKYKK